MQQRFVRSPRTADAGRRTAGRVLAPPAANHRLTACRRLARLQEQRSGLCGCPLPNSNCGPSPGRRSSLHDGSSIASSRSLQQRQRAPALEWQQRRGGAANVCRRPRRERGACSGGRGEELGLGRQACFLLLLHSIARSIPANDLACCNITISFFAFTGCWLRLRCCHQLRLQAAAGHAWPAGLAPAASCSACAHSLVSANTWPQWLLHQYMHSAPNSRCLPVDRCSPHRPRGWRRCTCTPSEPALLRTMPAPCLLLAALQSQPHYRGWRACQ